MKVCLECQAAFESVTWNCPICSFMPKLKDGFLSFHPELADKNENYNVENFDKLALEESMHFWFKCRNELIEWAIQKYFPSITNFLEVGCGTGFVSLGIQTKLPTVKLFGSEIYSKGLDHAKKRLVSAELFQMDARSIPFKNEFDLIGAFDVIEHIKEDVTVLRQIHQALKLNGGLILTVPQHPFLWSQTDVNACHVRRYTANDLIKKLSDSGFKIIRKTSFVSFLLPMMFLSRLLKKTNAHESDINVELTINPILNSMLIKILRLENALIKRNINFSLGGSLLIAATKISN